MVGWCPSDESISDFSDGPTICFVVSVFTIPLDIIFLIVMAIRLRNIIELMEFDYIDQMIKIQASFISGTCVCMCIFAIVFGLVMDRSVSTWFYITLEVITWLLAAVLVKIEGYRLVRWPHPSIVAYFILSCIFNILIAAITVQTAAASVMIDSIFMVIGSFVAVVLSLLKIACRSDEEAERMAMYSTSMEFNTSNPVQSGAKDAPSSVLLRTLKLDKLLGENRGSPSRSMKNYEDHSWWKWTRRQPSHDGHIALLSDDFEVDHHSSFDHTSSKRQSQWFSFLRESFRGRKEDNSSSGLTSADLAAVPRRTMEERPPSLDLEEDGLRRMNTESSDGGVSVTSSTGSMSRAIAAVLDQHRARVNASNPLLEPKHSAKQYKSRHSKESDGWDSQRQQSSHLWHVTVQRWGIRNRHTNSDHDSRSASPTSSPSPCPAPEKEVEIEFEIEVTRRSADSSISSSTGSEKVDKNTQSCVVWRTASELLTLHAALISLQGDYAPRRPRLKSATDQSVSNAELNVDMRSISLYLTSILRNPSACKVAQVVDFLNMHELVKSLDALPAQDSDPEARPEAKKRANTMVSLQEEPSLMEAAEINASSQATGKEKWRKMFMQMRIKLKPHDIAIHCRLFEGVISGEDVAGWLMRNTNTGAAAETSAQAIARDRSEACTIGQELLSTGLIIPVCAGFDEDHDPSFETEGSPHDGLGGVDASLSATATATATGGNSGGPNSPFFTETSPRYNREVFMRFSVMPGFVYRFPGKSGTAGSWSLLGGIFSVKIPTMSVCEDNESTKYTRETVGFVVSGNQVFTEDIDEAGTGTSASSGTYVKYLIDITHGGDTWQTNRRYREFEQLHKTLLKEGIKPDAALPSKTLVKPFSLVNRGPTVDDNRRLGLEQYLRFALQATVDSSNDRALQAMALFLDDDFHALRINADF